MRLVLRLVNVPCMRPNFQVGSVGRLLGTGADRMTPATLYRTITGAS